MVILIVIVSFLASMLTLFSGFGLGTILLPAFGLFFPIQVAVALTGIVHLLNNLFKTNLLWRHASMSHILRFGIPSVIGGFLGAWLLLSVSQIEGHLAVWHWQDHVFEIKTLKVVIALLMILFALQETLPALKNMNFPRKYLPFGGLVSGFFGGLSGHQGALRSAFLINAGLAKEQFIATGVIIACMVDLTRIPVYLSRFQAQKIIDEWQILVLATLSAFLGAWIGMKYMKKVTLQSVQRITAIMIVVIAVLLMLGII